VKKIEPTEGDKTIDENTNEPSSELPTQIHTVKKTPVLNDESSPSSLAKDSPKTTCNVHVERGKLRAKRDVPTTVPNDPENKEVNETKASVQEKDEHQQNKKKASPDQGKENVAEWSEGTDFTFSEEDAQAELTEKERLVRFFFA
jgi:hypothetical protein